LQYSIYEKTIRELMTGKNLMKGLVRMNTSARNSMMAKYPNSA
jgi:hypothetical protein